MTEDAAAWSFTLLDEVAVERPDRRVMPHGRQQRIALTMLLLKANKTVSGATLAEQLWHGNPPRKDLDALRRIISDLRRLLRTEDGEASRIGNANDDGWSLRVEPGELDTDRFERAIEVGNAARAAGDLDGAVDAWREALALSTPRPMVDVVDDLEVAKAAAAHWADRRLTTLERCIEAEIDRGNRHAVVDEVQRLVDEHPFREELVYSLMRAQYYCGRQTDALASLSRLRTHLRDELGLNPDPRLIELERQILQHTVDLPMVSSDGAGSTARSDRPGMALGPGEGSRPEITRALPAPLTRLIGRKKELDEARTMIATSRLVTLTGTAGCGKTRLAVEVARTLESSSADLATDDALRFEHGIAFVDLAPITDPSLVLSAIAGALGMSHHGTAEIASVQALVGSSRILIVLDNCEQVRDTCSRIVADLLTHCPGAKVLATSREYLAIGGERILPVAPLGVAGPDDVLGRRHLSDERRQQIFESEAVQLFLARVKDLVPNYLPDDNDLLAFASMSRRLDGIPLAIELVAPFAAALSPSVAAQELEQDRALLDASGRPHDPVDRQATMRAALEWSFKLLSPLERDLFQRVSVFVGPFTLEAARQLGVAGGRESHEVTLALANLIRKSMIAAVDTEGPPGTRRLRLLETMRGYGLELLGPDAESTVRDHHAHYYLGVAVAADVGRRGQDARECLETVGRELSNFRAALWWSFERKNDELASGLAGALHWFFGRMGRYDELCKRLDVVLERREKLDEPHRLRAVLARSTLAWSVGEYEGKEALAEEAINLAEATADDHQLLIALVVRAGIAAYSGDGRRAAECVIRAKPMAEALEDAWAQGWVALTIGISERRSGRLASAQERCKEALRLFEAMDNDQGRILPLVNLAILSQQQGDFDAAIQWCTDAVLAAQRLGDRQQLSVTVATMGRLYLGQGDIAHAREMLVTGLDGFTDAVHWPTIAMTVEGLAKVALHYGRVKPAAVVQGYADALRRRHNIASSAEGASQREDLLRRIDLELDEPERDRAFEFGATLSLDQVVRRAVEASAPPESEPSVATWETHMAVEAHRAC